MDATKAGWYTELGPMWPGQGLSLQVKEVLYRGKSTFQVRFGLVDMLRGGPETTVQGVGRAGRSDPTPPASEWLIGCGGGPPQQTVAVTQQQHSTRK